MIPNGVYEYGPKPLGQCGKCGHVGSYLDACTIPTCGKAVFGIIKPENWKHVENGVYAQDLQEQSGQLNYARKHNYKDDEDEEKPAVSEIAVKRVKLEPIDDEQKADEDCDLLKKLKEKHRQELVEARLRISRNERRTCTYERGIFAIKKIIDESFKDIEEMYARTKGYLPVVTIENNEGESLLFHEAIIASGIIHWAKPGHAKQKDNSGCAQLKDDTAEG
jgi:hypothetical protein